MQQNACMQHSTRLLELRINRQLFMREEKREKDDATSCSDQEVTWGQVFSSLFFTYANASVLSYCSGQAAQGITKQVLVRARGSKCRCLSLGWQARARKGIRAHGTLYAWALQQQLQPEVYLELSIWVQALLGNVDGWIKTRVSSERASNFVNSPL